MIASLFTYGTLQPGGRYWNEIQPWVVAHHDAQVKGFELWSFPKRGYPAIIPSDDDANTDVVKGTLLMFEPAQFQTALIRCDEIEGVDEELYQRILYTDEATTCHLYVYDPRHVEDLHMHAVHIPDGRWLCT